MNDQDLVKLDKYISSRIGGKLASSSATLENQETR